MNTSEHQQKREEMTSDIEKRWADYGFLFETVQAEDELANHNLRRVDDDRTVDCMDERDGAEERLSRKVAGASLAGFVLQGIDDLKEIEGDWQGSATLTERIKESLDRGEIFYWHDDNHCDPDKGETGCGFHDSLKAILIKYLTVAEKMDEEKDRQFAGHFLADGSPKNRIEELQEYAENVEGKVVKVSSLKGKHIAESVFVNFQAETTLVPLEGDKRHFVVDAAEEGASSIREQQHIELGLATIAVLAELTKEKPFQVYWLE